MASPIGENRIKETRFNLGLKLSEVAEKAGIHPNTYANYESNASQPSMENMEKIAEVLGVNKEDLIVSYRQPASIRKARMVKEDITDNVSMIKTEMAKLFKQYSEVHTPEECMEVRKQLLEAYKAEDFEKMNTMLIELCVPFNTKLKFLDKELVKSDYLSICNNFAN